MLPENLESLEEQTPHRSRPGFTLQGRTASLPAEPGEGPPWTSSLQVAGCALSAGCDLSFVGYREHFKE